MNFWLLITLLLLACGPVTYYIITSRVGKDDDWWNPLRRFLWPLLDHILEWLFDGYATLNVRKESRVGRFDMTVDEFEAELYTLRYYKNPVAALKKRPWRGDIAKRSLVRRDVNYFDNHVLNRLTPDVFAKWQTHVTLFENPDGTVVAFAHREYNSINPRYWKRHYNGTQATNAAVDVSAELRKHGLNPM